MTNTARRKRIEADSGLCLGCCIRPKGQDGKLCTQCKAKSKRLYKNHRTAGKCVKCGAPSLGTAACDSCAEMGKKHCRGWRDRHTEAGRCTACGGPIGEFALLLGRKTCGCVVARRRERNESSGCGLKV